MRLPLDTDDSTGPNLTPVIDIVFLLLIFFLVATRYDQQEQERETDIDLPGITEAEPLAISRDLVVNITREGRFRAAGREFNSRQLRQLLEKSKQINPHRSVLIAGDTQSALGHTVQVKGYCNELGLKCRIAAIQDVGKRAAN